MVLQDNVVDTVHSIFILEEIVFIFVLLLEFKVFAPRHNTAVDIVHHFCSETYLSRADWNREIFGDAVVRRTNAVLRPYLPKVDFRQLLQEVVAGSAGRLTPRNNRLKLEHGVLGSVGQRVFAFQILEQIQKFLLRQNATCVQFK